MVGSRRGGSEGCGEVEGSREAVMRAFAAAMESGDTGRSMSEDVSMGRRLNWTGLPGRWSCEDCNKGMLCGGGGEDVNRGQKC